MTVNLDILGVGFGPVYLLSNASIHQTENTLMIPHMHEKVVGSGIFTAGKG
jgi:hypothetical protein